ncbi:FtsK/SpoIIIE domain-containing protein [Protofrankia sp. BMG5.30]|uniref:FtsK/SpoIIIE domain-containing protein n=1 Tax=Protofrankia sp. BMG5.30 TaxID=1834514 RepID=UPI000976DF03|nr:FtsK/SpoIIIE domain-containing protein [Protofrankia sp. BMG5.30]ONH34951.1 cell division protein FtsK [Protofrankia sp. BMG5.30]
MSDQPERASTDTPAGGVVLPGPWTPTLDIATDARPAGGPVLDGEVIDQRGQVVPSRPGGVPVRRPVARPALPALPVGGKELARTAGRVVVQSVQGHAVLARRAVDAATHAAIREQIRAARARGDAAELAVWLDRLHAAKDARRQRVQNLPVLLKTAAFSAVALVLVVAAGLVGLGIVAGVVHPLGVGWGDYWGFWGWLLHALVTAVTVLVPLALAGIIPAWLVVTRRAGQDGATLPARLAPPGQRPTDSEPITPSIVVTALRDLGLPALRKAIQAMPDHGAGMLGPIRLAGCGVEVDVTLPSGVATNEVQDRRRKLAENLTRHEHELFITIPEAARTVRLWIADSGALDEPIGPSPLVLDSDLTADYRTGRAPWGQDLRGDAALISLYQRHLLITGLSNQGKTAGLRALALWLAQDPTVEFWIADLKGVGDWAMFDGIATRLIQGPTDAHVIQATEMVEDAVTEMERRNEAARAGATFHPLIVIVDEAQVAFMCPAIGDDGRPYGGTKAKSRYFMGARKVHNQGRAVDVLLWQGTQDPTDQNLPKLVREGAHIRASLVVGTEAQAKMALGDKAVNGGAAPHKLRQGLDKGTLVVAGDGVPLPPGASSLTIRTHFIDDDDADALADRAQSRRTQVAPRTATGDPTEDRDPLTDIAVALRGEDRTRTPVVLARLAEIHPSYQKWTFQTLSAALATHHIKIGKSVGQSVIRADDIHQAITFRNSQAEGSDQGSR